MNTEWGKRDATPLILNHRPTYRKWSASRLGRFTSGKWTPRDSMNSRSGRQSRCVSFFGKIRKKPFTPAKNRITIPLFSNPCLVTIPTTVSWLLFINTWVQAQRPYRKPCLCSNTHASGWSFRSMRHTNCTTNWLQNIFALVTSMTPNVKHHNRTQCNCQIAGLLRAYITGQRK